MTTPAKILCVSGARPNFVKIAPLMRAIHDEPQLTARLVHTGQHYDDALSRVFFDELEIPRPDIDLEVGSASHAQQTAEIMRRFERVLQDEQPQAVLVVGDVNSTIACALVTAKFRLDEPFSCRLGARSRPAMIHVEAGLRSFDDEMPEEINRRLTDCISDLLFVSDPAGVENLRREGVEGEGVVFVGNVMIDTLMSAKQRALQQTVLEDLRLEERGYRLLTLHRPRNVDDPARLRELLSTLDRIAADGRIVFPVHPRTRPRLEATGLTLDESRWLLTSPLGYLSFLKLMACAELVLTDSGGVQEETTVLGVPCLTLRDNTERPVTVSEGTNVLAGTRADAILEAYTSWRERPREGGIPQLWDGSAAQRICRELAAFFSAPARADRPS